MTTTEEFQAILTEARAAEAGFQAGRCRRALLWPPQQRCSRRARPIPPKWPRSCVG
jgi:hypothetical protein